MVIVIPLIPRDYILSFLPLLGVSRPSVTVVALSGMNGSTLWSIELPEETRSLQCNGLSLGATAGPVCLVTGTSKFLSLLSASTGKVNYQHIRNMLLLFCFLLRTNKHE